MSLFVVQYLEQHLFPVSSGRLLKLQIQYLLISLDTISYTDPEQTKRRHATAHSRGRKCFGRKNISLITAWFHGQYL